MLCKVYLRSYTVDVFDRFYLDFLQQSMSSFSSTYQDNAIRRLAFLGH